MLNPNRGSVVEAAAMTLMGEILALAVLIRTGFSFDERVTIGYMYGLVSYMLWKWSVDLCGSICWDEEDEPEVLTGKVAIIALFLPVLSVVVLPMVLCAIIGWYMYRSFMFLALAFPK